MNLKALFAKPYARWQIAREQRWQRHPEATQEKVFKHLVTTAAQTAFGRDHHFDQITSPADFAKLVPIRDYEELKPYVERIIASENDVLWPGVPEYLAKTSGTTSGAKYIPITKVSMAEQVKSSKMALLNYIVQRNNADYVKGKMIFLQGSPVLDKKGAIKMGRLSGISAHYLPKYLLKNRLPSYQTNIIEDWETKVEAIVEETVTQDMTLIAGIPSWVQMYFERLVARTGKKVGELFPNFSLFVYGGVNFEPYRQKFEALIGRQVDSIELFPASEGFFAYQDRLNEKGLLLQLNSNIFYEFVRADEFYSENPKRRTIAEVELDVDYALIISSNAGLWAYNIGDTVRFVSLNPYRVIVSGRLKHFISAFGEHVIAKEVEEALSVALKEAGQGAEVVEFSVAPQVAPEHPHTLPYHEWFIEFGQEPADLAAFMRAIDLSMQQQNVYYKDLIDGKILIPAVLTKVRKGGFEAFMKAEGKLGGQNKIKRLSNDRSVADALTPFIEP